MRCGRESLLPSPAGTLLKGYRVFFFLSSILLISFLAGCTAAPIVPTPTLPPVATASPTKDAPSPTAPAPTSTPIVATPTAAPTGLTTPTPVPPTLAPIRTPAASPVDPSPTDWTTLTSHIYGLTLRYPASWTRDPRYTVLSSERFGGRDGFVQVAAAAATSIDAAANLEANHVLQPYGSRPTISPVQIQGQPARLILPSGDQPSEMNGQAALVVHSPRPLQVGTNQYGFVIIWADQAHIRAIGDTMRFIS